MKSTIFYSVHDKTVRYYHWVNVLFIMSLAILGMILLNAKTLNLSIDNKITVKSVHAFIGYGFVINLSWRFFTLFFSQNPYSHWQSVLVGGKNYIKELIQFIQQLRAGNYPFYLGYNPIARLMITLLFSVMLSQALTGLLLASTDLYWPPLGQWIIEWLAETNAANQVHAGYMEFIQSEHYAQMRELRKPIIWLHQWGFYGLSVLVLLHITAVLIVQRRYEPKLIQAMLTGKKYGLTKPVDLPPTKD